MIVDRDPLMGERVDIGNLGGEHRVGEMAEGKPLSLDQCADHLRLRSEVQNDRCPFMRWV